MCLVSVKILELGSNSSTSLANDNESFIVYSLVVIVLSNLSQNFANFYLSVSSAAKIGKKSWNPILQSLMSFNTIEFFIPKLGLALNLNLNC